MASNAPYVHPATARTKTPPKSDVFMPQLSLPIVILAPMDHTVQTVFLITEPISCVPCTSVPNCQTCANGPSCATCNPFFVKDLSITPYPPCVPCSSIPNCQTCIDGPVCTSCIANYAFDTSVVPKTCVPCSLLYKCLTCTDGPLCTGCQPGFFLDSTSSMCFPCQFPCTQCSVTSTNCTDCDSSTLYYHDHSAETCKLCHPKLDSCRKCDINGAVCYECNSNTKFIDSVTKQCVSCAFPCLECVSSTECTACNDNTFTLVPVSDPGSVICKSCSELMPNCISCLSPTVCTQCQTDFLLTYPPSSFFPILVACWGCSQMHPNCKTCSDSSVVGSICTQCNDKFYFSNNSCFDCPFSCATCSDISTCISCISKAYALLNDMCVYCNQLIPNCAECTDNTTCIKCMNGYIKNITTGSNFLLIPECSKCPSLFYPNQTSQTCDPCVPPCETCLDQNVCLSCVQFYRHVPAIYQCEDLCGDSVVINDPCDNGLGIFHDGCTDQCQPQLNYTCVNYSDTFQGKFTNRSVCSYDLPLSVSLFLIEKEPFKNIMTITYFIFPFLFGLPGTTSKVFTQDELKQIFLLYQNNTTRLLTSSDTSGVTVEAVQVNATNNKVSITFTYDHSIKDSDIQLQIDFQFLKNNLGLQNFDTTPDTVHQIRVSSFQPQSKIGQFYTEQQYSQAILLNEVATVMGIMSSLAFFIGIFTKEVVGLQMAMLCQFTYISLFFFQDTLGLPLFALKDLMFSTGYNLPLAADLQFQLINQNPPQSFDLGFDPRTFSNNFNLMTVLYILPLVLVIPFIPLKGKCIRKISMIELGHKRVDLLMGEIMLFFVLFNFQYLMFGTIAFYRDGRDAANYYSSMMIWFGVFCTISSFWGLIFRPAIHGNFRTCFRFNNELRRQMIQQKERKKECEKQLTERFEKESRFKRFQQVILSFKLFINENYFWRHHRKLHTLLTYNHYNFVLLYFCLLTLLINLMPQYEIFLIVLSTIFLIDLILMRPYFRVSEKLRAIYFAIVQISVTLIRYLRNQNWLGQGSCQFMCEMILSMLGLGLAWTYLTFVVYFYELARQKIKHKEDFIVKVFEETDHYDHHMAKDEEEKMMKKLMKRYERVELQYNVDGARDQLKATYNQNKTTNIRKSKKIRNSNQLNGVIGDHTTQQKEDSEIENIFQKAEDDKYYKNLRDDLNNYNRRLKKNSTKGKVSGDEMLKLLSLNDFSKYENTFLPEVMDLKDSDKETVANQSELGRLRNQVRKEAEREDLEQTFSQKDAYQSVEPQNLEEAEQKIIEEQILVDENQFVRYKRAMKTIQKEGLIVDKKLIVQRYDYI